jgi:hypothetical protein
MRTMVRVLDAQMRYVEFVKTVFSSQTDLIFFGIQMSLHGILSNKYIACNLLNEVLSFSNYKSVK